MKQHLISIILFANNDKFGSPHTPDLWIEKMRILFDLFVRFWSSRELANGGLLVVAGDVVPLDVVVVEVVEHGQADLVLGSVLVVVSVVRLRQLLLGPEIKLRALTIGIPTDDPSGSASSVTYPPVGDQYLWPASQPSLLPDGQ